MNFKKRVNGSWTDTPHYIHKTDTNTLTTLPAVLYPTGTTATVGLKGNTAQSGTPTPDNPIQPQGTGERTGNLYGDTDISGTINNTYYKNDFVYANLSQGTYTLAFDLETTATSEYRSSIGVGATTFSKDIQTQKGKTDGHFVFTFTISEEDAGKNLYVRYARFSTAVTVTYTASNIMLNTGTTALPYEPYGYKIPISSANTTTPVYLGEVETTRRIKKLVLTGEEANWYYYENATGTVKFFYLVIVRVVGIDLTGLPNTHGYSTHEITQQSGNTIIRIYTVSEGMETIEEWKSYLQQQYAAGTPVTVWYVLAESTTSIVNEPLRKIGDYADSISGITIPTIAGANTISVDTTLQPSEVTVNYKGWHPVADVHERENGAWT